MKITLRNNLFDTEYSGNTDISHLNQGVVVIPNGIYGKLTDLYRPAGHNTDNGLHGLPNPLSVLTGEDLEIVQKETSLYNLRQQINAEESPKTQLGMSLDVVALLSKGFVELLDCIDEAADLADLKSKIANTQLNGLRVKFKEINPELPPEIKGAGKSATDFLEFQHNVAQFFKVK